jgi:hypothetical protein
MRMRQLLRIAGWHLALYCFVIFYILSGAYIFHILEGEFENERHVENKKAIRLLKMEVFDRISNSKDASFRFDTKKNSKILARRCRRVP